MIRCNLAVLLAERGTKISRVSEATGISRTTLTALANNTGKGVQFDTINTICNYLNTNPNKLISYVPVDIDVNFVYLKETVLEIELKITKSLRTHSCSLTGHCYENYNSSSDKIEHIDISIELITEYKQNNIENNNIIVNSFKLLDVLFRNEIQDKITNGILYYFKDERNDNGLTFSFTWDKKLLPSDDLHSVT